ncbi:MAG: RNA 2',3'-cyclic phosphodiesterase [bacterium]|jgi:RNA 2',3'-cyclic 3'-phosphodiesterase
MMKRLFAALKIPPGEIALANYYRLKKSLQQERIKWVQPDNFHLTLKFFGGTPVEEIERISKILMPLAEQQAPIYTHLSKTGVFGSRYAPRVIWFGFGEEKTLSELGNRVLDELDKGGFEKDRQNFVPHLTIARIKQVFDKKHFQDALRDVAQFEPEEFCIREMTLYESILKPEGPVYVPLQNYPFGK